MSVTKRAIDEAAEALADVIIGLDFREASKIVTAQVLCGQRLPEEAYVRAVQSYHREPIDRTGVLVWLRENKIIPESEGDNGKVKTGP